MVLTSNQRTAETSSEASELAKSVHGMIRVMLRHLQPIVEAEGVSKGQFWAMHVLSGRESASVNDIAQHLSVSPPTMSVTIDQLEAVGLVTRERSSSDRRTVAVSLTPKGRKVEAKVWARIERQISEAVKDLPRSDVATTAHVIQELSRLLESSQKKEGDKN